MNVKLVRSIICLILLLQLPNSSKAVELSYTLNFNGFRYDKIAVSDALNSFFGVEPDDKYNRAVYKSDQFQKSIQKTYNMAFDILDHSLLNRVGINIRQEFSNNVMFNISLCHGQGSSKYRFPDGISILTDPAIMYSRFSENLLSLSLENRFSISEKTYIFLKAGSNFAAVDIDTHITSALLDVRSSEAHHITYPDYTLGVRFEDNLSISTAVSFAELNDPINSISISLSFSHSY